MIWNKILNWFRDMSERIRLMSEWNKSAKEAYISGAVPSLLEATTSRGNSNNRHELSKLFISGFRIKVKSGLSLSKMDLLNVGRIILNNSELVRRIIVLGWDTLEVYDAKTKVGVQWALKDFMNLRIE